MKNLKFSVPKEYASVNLHRLEQNPKELKLVNKWREENSNHLGDSQYILLSQLLKREPTASDCQTAETIMQWLGSPVGQGFLSDLKE